MPPSKPHGPVVLPPERESGNVEYKRQILSPSPERLVKLTTQLSYRLDEGDGEAIYEMGVEDGGGHSLLSLEDVVASVDRLEGMARQLNAVVTAKRFTQGMGVEEEPTDAPTATPGSLRGGVPTRCQVRIRRVETHLLDTTKGDEVDRRTSDVSETLSKRNVRVAVVGNVDAGKSTLIGSMTTNTLDDGRGRCRTSIMRHRHEIESGRTSTATTHLLGFRSDGAVIGGRDRVRAHRRRPEDEVAREADRVVTFMDLAGHERYLKTTIHGVSSGFADYALVLVNSRQPPTHMTQHHLNLCCSFGIPPIVVFTKADGCPEHAFKNSREEVCKMLRAPDVARRPFKVRNKEDVDMCLTKMHQLAPMFETSAVTGEGMDLLQRMLFHLPKRRKHENKIDRPFEFLVEDIFNVPGVGAVVSGFVNAGTLNVGSHVHIGPLDDGTFLRALAKSAHIARTHADTVVAGQSACLALNLKAESRRRLRRGMVVAKVEPSATREFDAEICVLKGEGTTIRRSYQAYVHILNVRQSAFAKHIEMIKTGTVVPVGKEGKRDEEGCVVLRPGARAKVRFEFAKRPEYVRPGMRMLFRDGRVRGVGIITGVPEVQTAAS
uniref:Elongation factor Tu, chloroplastic n=2 Tax=Corethron hystrix TaxID=216773 RepID=A0A7S1BH96_9STRA|mmetsp:Transcript_26278/g.60452  ORF Transcript_26278/g.60452 Transcript_26278/m.60452 type:complete len:605 (+) Transcript_26278:917-2731(+)